MFLSVSEAKRDGVEGSLSSSDMSSLVGYTGCRGGICGDSFVLIGLISAGVYFCIKPMKFRVVAAGAVDFVAGVDCFLWVFLNASQDVEALFHAELAVSGSEGLDT